MHCFMKAGGTFSYLEKLYYTNQLEIYYGNEDNWLYIT